MQDLGISVLYIPDEWNNLASKTYEQALEAMHNLGLTQVDLAIMHGAFDYQLPVISDDSHNFKAYNDIVKYYINIGHVHTFTTKGKVIAQGSFDRLTHGEEEPKGGVEVVIRKDGTKDLFFIENKNAKIFKTIKITTTDNEKSVAKINKLVSVLPLGSYVRIKAKKGNSIFNVISEIQKQYPDITFSKLTDEQEENSENTENLFTYIRDDSYIAISINRDNISRLVEERLISNGTESTLTNDSITLLNSLI
jgi:DNA repair exonuclease SbcCD nuclease subunit